MLSYRHAFHAGNHADVLKHWIQVLCLVYMKRKDKAFHYLDTHAGAGLYALSGDFARKTGEYQQGIQRLWQATEIPEIFADYMAIVQGHNLQSLEYYPGSAIIAAELLRHQDRLWLAELHRADLELLKSNLGRDKRLRILNEDGFQQLKALLPPESRRGLVLIDPPYEKKSDYQHLVKALQDGLKRFATGTYLVWYPLLNQPHSQGFAQKLQSSSADFPWLSVELKISALPAGMGMYGSGMFILNPPYTLHEQLQSGLPWLTATLGLDKEAGYTLQSNSKD